jgi:hypothetical protein
MNLNILNDSVDAPSLCPTGIDIHPKLFMLCPDLAASDGNIAIVFQNSHSLEDALRQVVGTASALVVSVARILIAIVCSATTM